MENENTNPSTNEETVTIESLQARIRELEAQNASTESARVKAMEAQSRVSSELSKVKKDLSARMSEEEKKESERQAREQEMLEKIAAYEREKTVTGYKTSYMGKLKYSEEEASQAAEALANGDMESLFAIQMAHQASLEQTIAQGKLINTPVPPAGNAPKAVEDMTDEEYYAYLRTQKK